MRPQNLRLLVLDVDGVLTDGGFVPRGAEAGGDWKRFHSHDGLGLRLLQDAGIRVALLSGRRSDLVEARAKELGILDVDQGSGPKLPRLQELCSQLGLGAEHVGFMGDDLPDLAPMRWAAFSAAPKDARFEARDAADFVAPSRGGHGAVRDVCEHLLRLRGQWDAAVRRFDG